MTLPHLASIIVLLVPTITHTSAAASAFDRVLEVGVGGLTGFIVSFVLLPSRAHRQAADAAADTLDTMAHALRSLIEGLAEGLDMNALHRIQDGIGHSLSSLSVLAAEAERERSAGIVVDPHTGPLLRTLLRLRHDLIYLGRAALAPSPKDIHARVQLPLERIGAVASEYLHASGAALATHVGRRLAMGSRQPSMPIPRRLKCSAGKGRHEACPLNWWNASSPWDSRLSNCAGTCGTLNAALRSGQMRRHLVEMIL